MKERVQQLIFVGVVLALMWFASKPGTFGPVAPKVPVVKADAATYVYEKDANPVPAPVRSALNTLNRQGIKANEFEQDTKDGTGDVPEQFKVPLVAAKEAGLPALVVTGEGKVIRTVKAPTTEQQVLEAAK